MCPYNYPKDQNRGHHSNQRRSPAINRLFSGKTGLVFKGLKRSWTQHPMKEWIREAGITKNITFHSYRRTYATLQGAAGTDIRTIQSNMAHKSITTTQRYMKVVDSNKREASNRISLIRK